MTNISIDVSQNKYANDANYCVAGQEIVTLNGRQVQKITYHKDNLCLLGKISQLVFTIIATIATLGVLLCFSAGRQLWADSINNFKRPVVYQNIPDEIPGPNQANKEASLQLKKDEILTSNPQWRAVVETWEGVSLVDQVWVLQLFELRKLEIKLDPLDDIMGAVASTTTLADKDNVGKILIQKSEIDTALSRITELCYQGKPLSKCPDAIALLPNLQELVLSDNKLTTPPDVSKNLCLKRLSLRGNELTTPPDTSKNLELADLDISLNKLTTLPNTDHNLNLIKLYLEGMLLTTPPNVNKNSQLEILNLNNNRLTTPPDVSMNNKLKELALNRNRLTTAPDVRKNPQLKCLSLCENVLTVPPDVSHNALLDSLQLSFAGLTTPPDVSKNPDLNILNLESNQLETLPDVNNNPKLRLLVVTNNPLNAIGKQQAQELRSRASLNVIDF